MKFRDEKIELPPMTGELQNANSSKTEMQVSSGSGASRSFLELQEDISRVSQDTWASLRQWGEHDGRMKPFQITLLTLVSRKLQKGGGFKKAEMEQILGLLKYARENGFQNESQR